MRQFKIIVEKHPDGYVAYPWGIKGVFWIDNKQVSAYIDAGYAQ